MTKIIAEFNYVNKTQGYRSGDEEPAETRFETTGELYRFCLREYGRCISSCYVDREKGKPPRKIGWVFEKRQKYEDCNETFLQETWVTIHTALPERHTTWHYADLR